MVEKMLGIKEFADLTHYSVRQIRQFCIDGKIKGAQKLTDDARKWLIPASAVETLGKSEPRGKETTFPKISVTMKNGRVESIRKDEQHDNWIGAYIKQHKKLPILPDFLLPVVNKYQKGQPISKDIEVIPASGQYWNQRLLNSQREQLLELVEWLGDTHYPTASDYVGLFESMYPRDPDFSKRWKPFEQH